MLVNRNALFAVGALALILAGGCKKPNATAKNIASERVYVSVADLERVHPLARTVRQLEEQAQALQKERIPLALSSASPVLTSPLSSDSGISTADTARNQAARREVLRSALVTLERYSNAVQNTIQRIRAAERDELEGVARANSAQREAEERARLEDEFRSKLTDSERTNAERAALIRRNAARANLRDGNVLTLARDPQTQLPTKETLEAQIEKIRAHEKDDPENKTPLVVSDEARLTKTLRDQQALLTALREENNAEVAALDKRIAAAIAAIYADDLKWVEEQLAKSPRGAQNRAQIAALRTELASLIERLRATTSVSALPVPHAISPAPAAMPALVVTRPVQADVLHRLAKERRDLQATIHRDVTSAVRDVAAAHQMEPIFSPAYNLPNKTADFRSWIFGNVPLNTLSKDTK